MRYVPIYLRQGLVILSLTSSTFLLLQLPLFSSSWRIGRGRTRDLTPHLLCMSSLLSCGHRSLWLGFWCIPKCLPFIILWVQDALLFLLLESEEHVLFSSMETDFSSSHVDPCSGGPQEWSPKNELDSEVTFYVHHYKSGRTKESRMRTNMFLAIPSGYRIVESASYTHIYVGERAGYKSFSYITIGMILTLAPRSQSACSQY